MPNVVRWSPMDEAVSLRQAMDRLFEESVVRPYARREAGHGPASLPIDMYENEDELVIKARMPGVNPDDVEISVHGDNLYIKAELASDAQLEEAKSWTWYRHELFHGSVARSLTLPTQVQADKAEATFRNGELTLVIPKADEVKPRSIKIKTVS